MIRKYGLYALPAVLVMAPLLGSGYIFALDMVPSPAFPDWLQKLALLAGLVAASVGAHRFFEVLWDKPAPLAPYFAGLFYMFNPFIYSHFMVGQYLILLGYVLLPFFLCAWVLFLRAPSWQRAARGSLWLLAISIISVHTLGMAVLAAACLAVVFWWQRRSNTKWLRQAGKGMVIVGGAMLLVCSYWLIPALLGRSKAVEAIAGFNSADLSAFATHAEGFGLLGNVLSLQGFWADTKNLYIIPLDVFSWWWLPWIGLWALIICGIYTSWRRQRGITAALIGMIGMAAILAIGTAGTIAAPLNEFLVTHLPFFAGYREPQKFVALIALAYTYFGAAGVEVLSRKSAEWFGKRNIAPAVLLPVLALPFLSAPLMLWGFSGQLAPRHYPADWYALNNYLSAIDPKAKVLFLPWHLYMRFDFAGRVIANPAPKFFNNPIIISNNPEMKGAKSYTATSDQQELQAHILPKAKSNSQTMARDLLMLNIRYVIVAKELDYKQYGYLNHTGGMTLLKATDTLMVYKVTSN